MDWTRVFKDLRKKENGTKSFVDAVFDQDSWFLRGLRMNEYTAPVEKPIRGERREIIQAIGQFAQENNLITKTEVSTALENNPTSIEELNTKFEIPVTEKKVSSDKKIITHELDEKFEDWNSYLSRRSGGVHFHLGERSLNSISNATPDHSVSVVFVGDTFNESREHEDLLGKMIAAMQLEKNDFLRFYFQDNFSDEDYTYSLMSELYISKPSYVVSLGAKVTSTLLQKKDRLSKVHGKFFPSKIVQNKTGNEHHFEVIPVFHPDFLRINPSMKRAAWTDLQKIMQKLTK